MDKHVALARVGGQLGTLETLVENYENQIRRDCVSVDDLALMAIVASRLAVVLQDAVAVLRGENLPSNLSF